ncbi:uncharacterized protein B0T15DRAFT_567797 [Chaetomium strumarium]|uniref:Gamma-glutamylcyclotransferase AIG2-like domain-containing protein n=1 Tax=Chaetomium strumarium TaxID=1170767 RepID=A0AAJ0M226_9PEZI|nr:hypothetical protein B0T15DRAFT_567797 [Chaetomium strumarium]
MSGPETSLSSSASAEPPANSVTTTCPPPPPPLPPLLASARAAPPVDDNSRPSPFLEKLDSMPANYVFELPEEPPYIYTPSYYFFYGTLMNPDILKGAEIYGYSLSNWGQYKALVDGEPSAVVTGCAYMVQSVEEEFKLAYYETNAYELALCEIYFTDAPSGKENEEPVVGRTFKYAGDAEALKDGRFDRTLWELQMGRRLPPAWRTKTDEA